MGVENELLAQAAMNAAKKELQEEKFKALVKIAKNKIENRKSWIERIFKIIFIKRAEYLDLQWQLKEMQNSYFRGQRRVAELELENSHLKEKLGAYRDYSATMAFPSVPKTEPYLYANEGLLQNIRRESLFDVHKQMGKLYRDQMILYGNAVFKVEKDLND